MSELKACPFCGNKTPAVVHHFVNGIANLSHCFIRCNCGRGKTTASRKEEQGAMNEWNTRPIEDELRAEIARLKEENHALDQINRDIQTAAAHLDEVLAELARRDEELALTEKKLCNIDRSARAEVARRDEIIARLKEVGGWMYIAHDEKDIRECEDWRALMKELE